MKFRMLFPALIALFVCSCAPRHHHGCGFVDNPDFGQFGASLDRTGGCRIVKSYIRSEVWFRTEYIYENFDITIPETLATGTPHDAGTKGVAIWYAKGGQVGQIETRRARGTFTIRSCDSDRMVLDLDLTFHGFTVAGGSPEVPESISRRGTLTAIRGYELY
ncbi:MAG: hypothetical protein JXA20_02460 [Spirochaetes bacterium]|nr:hypothetical protein [Spirochaetota bacterium]